MPMAELTGEPFPALRVPPPLRLLTLARENEIHAREWLPKQSAIFTVYITYVIWSYVIYLWYYVFAMPSCEVLSGPVSPVSSLNIKYSLSVGKVEKCVKTKTFRNSSKPIKHHQAIFTCRVTPIWSWLPFGHFWHPWARGCQRPAPGGRRLDSRDFWSQKSQFKRLWIG